MVSPYTSLSLQKVGALSCCSYLTFRATSRVRSLTPELSKGLEFDLVILADLGLATK